MESENEINILVERSGTCSRCKLRYSWSEYPDVIDDFYNEIDYCTIEVLYKSLCESCFDDQVIIDEYLDESSSADDTFSSTSTTSTVETNEEDYNNYLDQ